MDDATDAEQFIDRWAAASGCERANCQLFVADRCRLRGVPPPGPAATAAPAGKRPWPAGLPEQIKVVAEVLATSARPLSTDDLAARFTARGRWRDRVPTIVATLEAIGRARHTDTAGAPAWVAM
ncbi:hypothetical protein [Azohydromonas sp.]|uniref:hypothetical protein n=1 Tax=Azohydromonas sp. TaxID=1872666 RepID=UPI002CD6044A|nr:hypothetical protein [Azohydromonas sp.]HMM83859.1 hypothetical protein [Azohydromonas sp.]